MPPMVFQRSGEVVQDAPRGFKGVVLSEIRWQWSVFGELSPAELYAALALRQRVFVVEQACVFLDADGRDAGACHLLGWRGDALHAYVRVTPPGDGGSEIGISRVVTAPEARGAGLGHALMREGLRRAKAEHGPLAVHVSAQAHLERFYEAHGFATCGEPYLLDGIFHVEMRRPRE